MQFKIVAVGSIQTAGLAETAAEYVERTDRYVTTDVVEVSSGSGGRPAAVRADEARALDRAAPEAGTRVALDEGGRTISSEKFADWIDAQTVGGVRYISFVLGGAHGLEADFRENKCDWSLSLSKMTLPHELARVVLAEQLYRAMTIVRGEPYHKG